jgi:hypothetical protein
VCVYVCVFVCVCLCVFVCVFLSVIEIMNVAQQVLVTGCCQQGSEYAFSLPGREFV